MNAVPQLVPVTSEHEDSHESSCQFELAPGTVLDARYRIIRGIGGGGMGHVYEALHLRLGHSVAVKVLRGEQTENASRRRRFEREAQTLAKLENEHVVRVFDFGLGPTGQPFLVMEYLRGYDVRALLRQEVTLTTPRALRLVLDVCAGLQAAHESGIVHRDLKPENLFVIRSADAAEHCKILDFGLAKLVARTGLDLRTKAGAPLGTLNYMSPEQARGEPDVDARSDVYSLCAILYEMLSGERLHRAETQHALLYQVIHDEPRRLEEICPFVPPEVANAIHRGLSKARELRTESVARLVEQLRPFVGERTPADQQLMLQRPSPNSRTEDAPDAPPSRRSRWPLRVVGAAAVATVLVLSIVRAIEPALESTPPRRASADAASVAAPRAPAEPIAPRLAPAEPPLSPVVRASATAPHEAPAVPARRAGIVDQRAASQPASSARNPAPDTDEAHRQSAPVTNLGSTEPRRSFERRNPYE